jgi:hypothetical protein
MHQRHDFSHNAILLTDEQISIDYRSAGQRGNPASASHRVDWDYWHDRKETLKKIRAAMVEVQTYGV